VGTAALSHFLCKLVAMGVFMAINAFLFLDAPVVAWWFARVAGKARHSGVASFQGECGFCVALRTKKRRSEALHSVAGCTVPVAKAGQLATVHIFMAVAALFKLQPSVALCLR